MSLCKLTHYVYILLKVTFSAKLEDPFRDKSLKHCFSINKIEINKGIMPKLSQMVAYGSWLSKQS